MKKGKEDKSLDHKVDFLKRKRPRKDLYFQNISATNVGQECEGKRSATKTLFRNATKAPIFYEAR